jgi:DNA polymerase-1
LRPLTDVKLHLVETLEEAFEFRSWLGERRPMLGFDLETTGLHYARDHIRLAQFGDANEGWAIPCDRWGYGRLAADAFREYRGPMIAHNAIFDTTFLAMDGIDLPAVDDSMVMAHLDRSGWSLSLKRTAERLIGREATAGEGVLNEAMKKQRWSYATVPEGFPGYWKYSALDPVLTCRIAADIEPRVFPELRGSYDMEVGAIRALREAQVTGMRVDLDTVRSESARLGMEMQALKPQLPCNANSPKQIVAWLEERFFNLGDIVRTRTEAGEISVDDDVLTMLAEKYDVPEATIIREYRKRAKMKNGYFDNLLETEVNGIVRPHIRVLGAEKTGRMSVSEPALQTLPRTKLGRKAFIAREDHTLVMMDFAGQELRLLAHMSGDEQLKQLFRDGTDPHRWLAARANGIPEEQVTPPLRQVSKNGWYAILYGAGIPKFALTAGISEHAASEFMATVEKLFPRIRPFQAESAREVHETAEGGWGYARTWTGKRLMVRTDQAYKATNVKIQGGCAEILKLKICELMNAGFGPYIRVPVHDEIVSEVPDERLDLDVPIMAEVMRETELFDVPFPVDIEIAKCWGDKYP